MHTQSLSRDLPHESQTAVARKFSLRSASTLWLHEQQPILSRALPLLLEHGPLGYRAVAAPLVKPSRSNVRVRDDDTTSVPARFSGALIGQAEEICPVSPRILGFG